MANRQIEAYAIAARDAGCPMDQVELFIRAGYVAQPVQLPFHAACRQIESGGPNVIAIGGTRNSAKTHAVFSQVGIDDCQRYPGLKFLYLRNYRKSAAESLDDLAGRLLRYVPHKQNAEQVEFPNGSRILIGGFKDQRDVDKFVGIEYDGVAIEEASLLSKDKIDALSGSIRSSRSDGYRARRYMTFNPGGVGYSDIKKQLIMPWRNGSERDTRFFFAHWKDNVFCDPDYIRYLDGLTGHLRKSWRDGDLDAFEGAAFPQWDEGVYTCEPFELPVNWPRWRAVDYGMNPDPFAAGWAARDLAIGRVYLYRIAYERGLTDTEQARLIRGATLQSEHIQMTFGGADMFARRDRSGGRASSNADEYAREGVPLTLADTGRISGKRKIDRLMGLLGDGKPGLMVFNDCRKWIETVPGLALKEGEEDIADGQDDHLYDMTRYLLTNYESIRPPEKKSPELDQADKALEAWLKARG